MSARLAEALAALVAERDELRPLMDRLVIVNDAIAALERLGGAYVPAPAPAVARAPRPRAVPAPAGPESVTLRPATGTCAHKPCGKTFKQPAVGRVRHYCSVSCGKKARKSGVAVRSAPVMVSRMPRADRPVDDAELDRLLARSKRGAA